MDVINSESCGSNRAIWNCIIKSVDQLLSHWKVSLNCKYRPLKLIYAGCSGDSGSNNCICFGIRKQASDRRPLVMTRRWASVDVECWLDRLSVTNELRWLTDARFRHMTVYGFFFIDNCIRFTTARAGVRREKPEWNKADLELKCYRKKIMILPANHNFN